MWKGVDREGVVIQRVDAAHTHPVAGRQVVCREVSLLLHIWGGRQFSRSHLDDNLSACARRPPLLSFSFFCLVLRAVDQKLPDNICPRTVALRTHFSKSGVMEARF